MKAKLIEDLSTDELIEIVKHGASETLEVLTPAQLEIREFINRMRLQPGNKAVPFRFLWASFRQFSRKPIRKTTFGNELSKYFKKNRSKYETRYLLSKNGLGSF